MTEKPYTLKEKIDILSNTLTKGFASKSLRRLIDKATSEDIFKVVENCFNEEGTHASIYIENNLKSILAEL